MGDYRADYVAYLNHPDRPAVPLSFTGYVAERLAGAERMIDAIRRELRGFAQPTMPTDQAVRNLRTVYDELIRTAEAAAHVAPSE